MKYQKIFHSAIALGALACIQVASAETELKSGDCTFTLGGQAQLTLAETSSQDDAINASPSQDTQIFFLDLKTGLGCKISAEYDFESMVRMRPLKGNTFDIQGHHLGSREAWLGIKHKSYGAIRYGRFLNRMVDQVDDYGAPSLYAEASAYSATAGDVTRKMSFRYISPELFGFQPEITAQLNSSKNQDVELFVTYPIGSFKLEGIYARNSMNGAYELANGGLIGTGNRKLTNSSGFAGIVYELSNGGKLRAGTKFNQFALPSNAAGFYDLNGSYKTVTQLNALMLSGEYPLGNGWSINGSLVRYLDSKTRGVRADDGANFTSLTVKYQLTQDLNVSLGYKTMRLDRSGAIPGSGTGANTAVPETTVNSLALADRQWVFGQNYVGGANAFKISRFNQINFVVSWDF